MSEHPKAIIALQMANASVLVVNSENLQVMREGLIELHKDFKRLLKECEDASVRHAAELREQAERFGTFRQEVSEAAQSMETAMRTGTWQGVALDRLKQFILPKPDPLVEVFREMDSKSSGTVSEEGYADQFRAAIEARGGKIVWEAGQ